MKLLTIALLLLCTTMLTRSNAQTADNSIAIGQKISLFSKILNEKRDLWIHVPASYSKGKSNKYPVVYVLDGDENFHALTGTLTEISTKHGNAYTPEMIVVGILNTDRTRDLTITHKTTGFGVDPEFAKNSGGGEKFTLFMQKELLPFIDSAYPTAPYRMLIGHSLGGMMVVNALLNHTEMFNGYIALDPSIWWDDQLLVKQAQSVLKQKNFKDKFFYMAVANTMGSNADISELRKDTATPNLHFRSEIQLIDALNSNKQNGLNWSYDYYKNETHPSVPLIGQYNGLRYVFNFHPLPFSQQLWSPRFNADSAIGAHYKVISNRMGYTVLPPEDLLNGMGHAFLESHMFEKAEGVFKLNLANYPNSPVVYAAMGDLYKEKKNNEEALRYYQKSLQLKNDDAIASKVKGLAKK